MKANELKSTFVPDGEYTDDLVWINVRTAPISVHGVFFDEAQGQFVRMRQDVADTTKTMAKDLNRCTAGGRARFRTDSAYVAMYAVMYNDGGEHSLLLSNHGFDLSHYDPNFGRETYAYSFYPPNSIKSGFGSGFYTDGKMKDYVLHMPTYGEVRELYIGVKSSSEVEAPTPYKHEKPIVFYGSSITQGGCASRPANIYEAVISRHLDTDYVNLGFSGSCLAEEEVVEHIAGLDMNVFVCDYDHNAPSVEHLEKTHLPIYRAVRGKHPNVPIVFVTAPNIMPDYTWHIPRRDVIRKTYETALSEGDENVYFIDGETFFDIADRDMCTTDTCHPNDLGMYLMAQKIESVLRDIL